MKILITGHKGFIGSETVTVLTAKPNEHEIIGYDLMDSCDVRDKEQFDTFVKGVMPDRILHLAAIARFADADNHPVLAYETNVEGTKNVAEIAGKYHIPLIYASTGSVYMPINQLPPITEEFSAKGNSVYGCTKFLGEQYVRNLASSWIILRYAHIYGKDKRYHGLIGGFLDRINRGLAPRLYGGLQSNDFTYVKDIALANKKALETSWDNWNQIYNIGTGEELTAEEAGNTVCELSGYEGEIEKKQGREVDPERFVYDVSKAKIMLGFEHQFSFKEGLSNMFEEIKLEHGGAK